MVKRQLLEIKNMTKGFFVVPIYKSNNLYIHLSSQLSEQTIYFVKDCVFQYHEKFFSLEPYRYQVYVEQSNDVYAAFEKALNEVVHEMKSNEYNTLFIQEATVSFLNKDNTEAIVIVRHRKFT